MGIKIYQTAFDNVIDSHVALGEANYEFAINKLYPLISRLKDQRKIQDKKFYKKLERDIVDGCIMPPITVAYISKIKRKHTQESMQTYVNNNVDKAFILDGIQRLNTLNRAKEAKMFNPSLPIYLNAIVCSSKDKLLYRMITLNNGQRPMTPRHQVEVLMDNIFTLDNISIPIQTEKERAKKIKINSFDKADFIKAYLAFITNSVNIENRKIIDEKMDQLLVGKIMEQEPDSYKITFEDVLTLIANLIKPKDLYIIKWLKNSNNLIGFTVGVKDSFEIFQSFSQEKFKEVVETFDEAFSALNPSKIKLGKYRRELLCKYISNFSKYEEYDSDDLLYVFADEIA